MRRLLQCLLLAAVAALSVPAQAQQAKPSPAKPSPSPAKPPPSPAKPSPAKPPPAAELPPAEQALELFRRGNELYKQDSFEEAESLYEGAWAISQTFDIASNLGHTKLKLGKHREAATMFAAALERWPQTGPTTSKQLALQGLDKARGHVASLRITVMRAGEPVEGAKISADGVAIGLSPLKTEIFLDPGEHLLAAALGDITGAPQGVSCTKGSSHDVVLQLPAPPPSSDDDSFPYTTVAAIALGAAGAGLAIGITGAVVSSGAIADIDELQAKLNNDISICSPLRADPADPADCSALDEAVGRRNDARGATVAGFLIAGAAGAAGVALLSAAWRSAERGAAGLTVTPVLGSTEQGVLITATF